MMNMDFCFFLYRQGHFFTVDGVLQTPESSMNSGGDIQIKLKFIIYETWASTRCVYRHQATGSARKCFRRI